MSSFYSLFPPSLPPSLPAHLQRRYRQGEAEMDGGHDQEETTQALVEGEGALEGNA